MVLTNIDNMTFCVAPNNASQPSPAGFDLGSSSSIGTAPAAAAGQGILIASSVSQGGTGGAQVAPNAVGGMPRPLLPPQQQPSAMGQMPMNNAQMTSNTPGTGPNNPRVAGPALNAALQTQQQQQQAAAGARNIRGVGLAESASNLEHIVRHLMPPH